MYYGSSTRTRPRHRQWLLVSVAAAWPTETQGSGEAVGTHRPQVLDVVLAASIAGNDVVDLWVRLATVQN